MQFYEFKLFKSVTYFKTLQLITCIYSRVNIVLKKCVDNHLFAIFILSKF